MHADDVVDALLRDAMAADVPVLSPGFDDRVLRSVRPRRLTFGGRVVLGAYAALSVAACAWMMAGLPLGLVIAATAVGVPVAAAAGVYARSVAVER
jgi:hypothetical protein